MSVDQALLYRSCIAIIDGVCPANLAKRTLAGINHARWITLALRINFLFMATPEPSVELFRLCWFVINIYCFLWFSAKQRWRATEAPVITFEASKLIANLPIEERRVLSPVFQRGFGHWAHCEQILLACLSSPDPDVRAWAVARIIKIRETTARPVEPTRKRKQKSGVRTFEIPSFHYDAKDFKTMIDWECEQVTEPPYTMKLSDAEIRQFESHPLKLDVPSNSQFVERHIRLITENGTRSSSATIRDGLAHATIAHRQLRGKKESKENFSKSSVP